MQADERRVKLVGRKVWRAPALAAPSRTWLGGVASVRRESELLRELAQGVRRCMPCRGILLCVEGLASYVTPFRRVFRLPGDRAPGAKGRGCKRRAGP